MLNLACILALICTFHVARAELKDRACELKIIASPAKAARSGAWTQATVLRAIQVLHSAEVSLNASSMLKLSTENAAIVSDVVGFPTTGARLLKAGGKKFGGWGKALEAAGLDPKDVSPLIRWTRDEIVG